MSRTHKLLVLGAALLAIVPASDAQAQSTASDPYNPSRFTVEPYLSQAWQKNDVSTAVRATDKYRGVGGYGVRVMFNRAAVSNVLSTFFNRARAGAFVTFATGDNDFSQAHYGVQADFPLFVTPATAGFRLDPFVSLGAGVVRSSTDVGGGNSLVSSDFALTPAVGTLVPITGAISFRGDLRDAITFGDKTRNNFIAEGGISIGF